MAPLGGSGQQPLESVGGVLAQRRQDSSVGVGGQLDRAVPQDVADGRKVNAVEQEERTVEVAEMMELQWLQAGFLERPFELEQNRGTEERASQVVGEDQVGRCQGRAGAPGWRADPAEGSSIRSPVPKDSLPDLLLGKYPGLGAMRPSCTGRTAPLRVQIAPSGSGSPRCHVTCDTSAA